MSPHSLSAFVYIVIACGLVGFMFIFPSVVLGKQGQGKKQKQNKQPEVYQNKVYQNKIEAKYYIFVILLSILMVASMFFLAYALVVKQTSMAGLSSMVAMVAVLLMSVWFVFKVIRLIDSSVTDKLADTKLLTNKQTKPPVTIDSMNKK